MAIVSAPDGADDNQKRFQVLALDGGGIRGIFTAALLAGLERDTGRSVLDHFDLVVGTSTGGIVALGLGAGLTPLEILDFGESLPHVFNDGSLCLHLEHDWTSNMLIVDTTLPWASEWLIHYEIWKFTGTWYGGGEWPPARASDVATATDAMLSQSGTQVVLEPT